MVLDCCCRKNLLLLWSFVLHCFLPLVSLCSQGWSLNWDLSTPDVPGRDPHHLLGCLSGNPGHPPLLRRKHPSVVCGSPVAAVVTRTSHGTCESQRKQKKRKQNTLPPPPSLSSWGHPTSPAAAPGFLLPFLCHPGCARLCFLPAAPRQLQNSSPSRVALRPVAPCEFCKKSHLPSLPSAPSPKPPLPVERLLSSRHWFPLQPWRNQHTCPAWLGANSALCRLWS